MEYDKQGIAERLKKQKEVLRMNVNNLTDTEVQQLIHRLKHPKNIISFNETYQNISRLFGRIDIEELIIDDGDIEYILSAYQGRLEGNSFSIHLRFKENHEHLIRVDVNPRNRHMNPDGTVVTESHLHIYNNQFSRKDAVAIPLKDSPFPNISTIVDAFTEFINYTNIKNE